MEFYGNPKPFGIIGMILGIFTLLFSVIPCIGSYAIIPAIIAFIFCLIAFLYAKKMKQASGIPLAGLIISVLAIIIGGYQYYNYRHVFEAKQKIEKSFDSIMMEGIDSALIKTRKDQEILDSIQENEKDSARW